MLGTYLSVALGTLAHWVTLSIRSERNRTSAPKPPPHTHSNPVYTPSTLWEWWRDGGVKGRARVLGDVLTKARLNLDVMDRLDMVGRTSEMARVFGIDFYSVRVRTVRRCDRCWLTETRRTHLRPHHPTMHTPLSTGADPRVAVPRGGGHAARPQGPQLHRHLADPGPGGGPGRAGRHPARHGAAVGLLRGGWVGGWLFWLGAGRNSRRDLTPLSPRRPLSDDPRRSTTIDQPKTGPRGGAGLPEPLPVVHHRVQHVLLDHRGAPQAQVSSASEPVRHRLIHPVFVFTQSA